MLMLTPEIGTFLDLNGHQKITSLMGHSLAEFCGACDTSNKYGAILE